LRARGLEELGRETFCQRLGKQLIAPLGGWIPTAGIKLHIVFMTGSLQPGLVKACPRAEILRGLDNLQEVEAVFQRKHFILRSQLLAQAHKAFLAAGVALPPTLREKK
jgi:hypothetical protein